MRRVGPNFQRAMITVAATICGITGGMLFLGSFMEDLHRDLHRMVGAALLVAMVALLATFFEPRASLYCTLENLPPLTVAWGDASQVKLLTDGFGNGVAPCNLPLSGTRSYGQQMWFMRTEDGVLHCGHPTQPGYTPEYIKTADDGMMALVFTRALP